MSGSGTPAFTRILPPLPAGPIPGGTAPNVIPDEAHLTGTLRSHSESVRAELPAWIEKMAAGIAAASDARVEFEYLPGHPGLAVR